MHFKSTLLILGLCASVSSAYALCGYQDRIQIDSNSGAKVLAAEGSGHVLVGHDDTSVTIYDRQEDADNCVPQGGSAILTLGQDGTNYCKLRILDNPYSWNPMVSQAECLGTARMPQPVLRKNKNEQDYHLQVEVK